MDKLVILKYNKKGNVEVAFKGVKTVDEAYNLLSEMISSSVKGDFGIEYVSYMKPSETK